MPKFKIEARIKVRVDHYEVDANDKSDAKKKAIEELKEVYDLDVYGMPHSVEHGFDIDIDDRYDIEEV